MIDISHRIKAFNELGDWLRKFSDDPSPENETYLALNKAISKATAHNGWFTREHILFSLKAWCESLTTLDLEKWLEDYRDIFIKQSNITIGVIMAGNLPLVGFHDFLSVLMAGYKIDIKLSSDDDVLLPVIIEKLFEIEPEFQGKIIFSTRLLEVDAVIATGSNNTARYFESYFGKYPNIIRKSRTSLAVLTGNETDEQLQLLADDLFIYFGLGCRNVTKLYLPEGFDINRIFGSAMKYSKFMDHNKYMNNYDYYRAIYLMNQEKFLENGFLVMKEEKRLSTPVSVLHYEFYNNLEQLKSELAEQQEDIQCVVSDRNVIDHAVYFGDTQKPALNDYADGVNTMDFLKKLIEA